MANVSITYNNERNISKHCVKCPYSELFWSLFSRIRTGYGEIHSKFRKIRTRKTPNTDTFHAVKVVAWRSIYLLRMVIFHKPFFTILQGQISWMIVYDRNNEWSKRRNELCQNYFWKNNKDQCCVFFFLVNPFHATHLFWYPLKIYSNPWQMG